MTERRLRTLEERPLNAEIPLEELAEPGQGTLHYVRNHFDVPELDPAAWRLAVDGAVERPLSLDLDEVTGLPSRTLTVTLECAGNGRVFMSPTPEGTPWGHGAVSTAEFTGTPLRAVLERASLDTAAEEILFVGADRGEPEGEEGPVPFARSLPRATAVGSDVLLAWAMDGEPLPPVHGRPLRLVVPGWYAMASVKWLVRISALTEPFRGPFQARDYVYRGEEGTPDGTPVTTARVRALVGTPKEGEEVGRGGCTVRGAAWSGHGDVVRVEVSDDGGRTWHEAELGEPSSPHAAVSWRYQWRPSREGAHELLARATDSAGHTQPLEPRWNEGGYGNNSVQRVRVRVR